MNHNPRHSYYTEDDYLIQIYGIFIIDIHYLIVFIIIDIVIIVLVIQRTSSCSRATATIGLGDYNVTKMGENARVLHVCFTIDRKVKKRTVPISFYLCTADANGSVIVL